MLQSAFYVLEINEHVPQTPYGRSMPTSTYWTRRSNGVTLQFLVASAHALCFWMHQKSTYHFPLVNSLRRESHTCCCL